MLAQSELTAALQGDTGFTLTLIFQASSQFHAISLRINEIIRINLYRNFFPLYHKEQMSLKQCPEIVSVTDTLYILTAVSAPATSFSFFSLIGYYIVIMHWLRGLSVWRGQNVGEKL